MKLVRALVLGLILIAPMVAVALPGAIGTARSGTTLWGNEMPPSIHYEKEARSVELGTRFASQRDAAATALRFYKTSYRPGTFTGTLWSASGAKLGTAKFVTGWGSGWQTAQLSDPVPLKAGMSYVVSYRAPAGAGFGVTRNFHGSSSSPQLTVPRTDAGVYTYGARGTFPRSSWRSSQYWVDVVTGSARTAPHTSPPTVPFSSATPTRTPTEPTVKPTVRPTLKPTVKPTLKPTVKPTAKPTPTQTTPAKPSVPAPSRPASPPPNTSPNAVGFPTSANTGVPAGWKPKREITGDYTVSGDGAVLEDVRITGGILYVRGSNVTIRRVELVSARLINEYNGRCYSGLKIEDTSILRGKQDVYQPVIQSGGYTATRVKLDGVSEGFRVAGKDVGCGPVVIQDSFAQIDPAQGCDRPGVDWHGDGLQGYWGVEVTLRHTTIHVGRTAYCQATSAFFYPDQNNTRATIDNVLLSGGGYVFRLETPGSVQGLKVVDDSWEYGPVDIANCSRVTWGAGNELVKIAADGSLKSVSPLRCEGW